MKDVYKSVQEFKKRYFGTVAWRLKKHAKVIEEYLNPNEEIIYVFCGQKNDNWCDIFSTAVIALTNKRIMIGQKRLLWGSYYTQITPDMYNDMEIYKGLIFGRIIIDTIKEEVILTNLSKKSLNEIETAISEFMMKEKQKYSKRSEE